MLVLVMSKLTLCTSPLVIIQSYEIILSCHIMETWVLFALLWMILSGIFTFIQKLCSQRWYDANKVVGYTFLGQILSWSMFWALAWFPLVDAKEVIPLTIINWIVYFCVNVFRLRALSYIDSAIFFPIHKAAGPTIVVLAGIYLFSESLSGIEIIWVIIGITVPLLLIHKGEKWRQTNLSKWVTFLVCTVLMSSFGAIVTKFIADTDGSIFLYLIITSSIGLILSYAVKKLFPSRTSHIKNEGNDILNKELRNLAIGLWVINTVSVYCLLRSFEGPLSIAYTINSFYILIPIVLSMIIYKEHMNARKAIVLSLTAILFFQI